jgi:hypothetical protein
VACVPKRILTSPCLAQMCGEFLLQSLSLQVLFVDSGHSCAQRLSSSCWQIGSSSCKCLSKTSARGKLLSQSFVCPFALLSTVAE